MIRAWDYYRNCTDGNPSELYRKYMRYHLAVMCRIDPDEFERFIEEQGPFLELSRAGRKLEG